MAQDRARRGFAARLNDVFARPLRRTSFIRPPHTHDPDCGTQAVQAKRRLMIALLGGLLAGWATFNSYRQIPGHHDFGQVWLLARSILVGENAYQLIIPGWDGWCCPLTYPLPAGLVALPLAPFSEQWAAAIFVAIGGTAFAWALMEHGYGPLAGFCSAALLAAATAGQWSPLFAGAVVVPWLGILFVAKPTVGAAMFISRPSWWPIVGGVGLLAVAFLVQPAWVAEWRHALDLNATRWAPVKPYRSIVTFPGGFLALLCLLRWRRPEARLVAALACVPLTPMPYETVPLFLVPRSGGQAALLTLASLGVQVGLDAWQRVVQPTGGQVYEMTGRTMTLVLYPLVTAMVLRRPNEGKVLAWLENRVATWPAWLRGTKA